MKENLSPRFLLVFGVVVSNMIIDQLSKTVIRRSIDPMAYIELYGEQLILTRAENTGAFLSLGADLPPVLKQLLLLGVPSLVLLIFTGMILFRKGLSKGFIIGASFMIGGGLSNIYDRIVLGSVTDFLHIDLGIVKTGVFNVADMSIVFGTALMLIMNLLKQKEDKLFS